MKNTPAQNTMNFFEAYLTVPIVASMYVAYKWWHRTPFMRVGDMDLHTGMRELDLAELLAEERVERAKWPKWKKAYKVFC